MQNAIRSFPSYSTQDMFSNIVTYNTKIVYIVQLLSQSLSCIQICYYERSSATQARPPLIPNHTHTHTLSLSLSPRVSLHPYLLLPHAIKSGRTPFLVAQNRLIVASVVSSLVLIAYLEVHLLHH